MKDIVFAEIKRGFKEEERGWIFYPLKSLLKVPIDKASLHIVAMRPGSVRGNHYHERCKEYLYTFGGKAEFFWCDSRYNRLHSKIIDDNKATIIKIETGIKHALKNIDNKEIFILAFRAGSDCTKKIMSDVKRSIIIA